MGTIKPGGAVIIVDTMGNIQVSSTVNGIILQESIQASVKKMLASASEYQDDYWGIALIFHDIEKLRDVQNGMLVVIP